MAIRKLTGGDYSLRLTPTQIAVLRESVEEQMTAPVTRWNLKGLDAPTRALVVKAAELRGTELQLLYDQLSEAESINTTSAEFGNGGNGSSGGNSR
jgi:hypothetical protein